MFVSQARKTWDVFELRYTLGLQFTSGGRLRLPEFLKTEPHRHCVLTGKRSSWSRRNALAFDNGANDSASYPSRS